MRGFFASTGWSCVRLQHLGTIFFRVQSLSYQYISEAYKNRCFMMHSDKRKEIKPGRVRMKEREREKLVMAMKIKLTKVSWPRWARWWTNCIHSFKLFQHTSHNVDIFCKTFRSDIPPASSVTNWWKNSNYRYRERGLYGCNRHKPWKQLVPILHKLQVDRDKVGKPTGCWR